MTRYNNAGIVPRCSPVPLRTIIFSLLYKTVVNFSIYNQRRRPTGPKHRLRAFRPVSVLPITFYEIRKNSRVFE